MSFPYEDTTWSAPFDTPLGAYQLENLSFEDYFQTRLCQTQSTNPLPSPTRRRQHPSTTTSTSASSLPSWDSNASSSSFFPISRSSSLPSLSWTSDVASSSDFCPIQPSSTSHNPRLSPFAAPLTEDELAFFANIDPSLLDSHLTNITANPSISHVPDPVGNVPLPSKKRPYTNKESEGLNNASNDASSCRKRRKLSTNGHQTLPHIPPPPQNSYYNGSNSIVIPNAMDNFNVPVPPVPTSHTNAMLSQTPYMFQNVPVNTPSAPLPTVSSAYYSAATQPCPSVPYGGAFNYPPMSNEINPNANSYTAASHDALPWDPLSYLTFPEVENESLDWTTSLPGSEYFCNATSFGATSNVLESTLVPPFLGQETPSGVPYGYNVANIDAFLNNETHSGVDFCQHSTSPIEISTTEHVAHATMSTACQPSTSEAASVEPVARKFKRSHPAPSSSSTPSSASRPNRAATRPKRREKQLLPSPELWTHNGEKYICLYKGPGKPGGCKGTAGTPRNLARHMRTHAHREEFLGIPEAESVAFNGLPEGLRKIVVTCPLDDADLHHCAYYREHGERWSEPTLKRPDNILKRHEDSCHPPQPEKKRKVKAKA